MVAEQRAGGDVRPTMTRHPYIAFEGPIGAGKTTLTGLLSAHLKATSIYEDVDGNAFLADFYGDKARWALPMQLWFLTARHRQLVHGPTRSEGTVIADYTFAKDAIFADLLLEGRDLTLYRRIASGLHIVEEPSLIVYLNANDDVLLERIARRARPYEEKIDAAYLDSVRDAYQHYFSGRTMNVFRYDTSSLDLGSSIALQELYDQILVRASERTAIQ